MRNGILTQAAYQRSVYRKLKDDHPGLPEYVWEHCTKIPASGEELVVSESLMTGNEQELFVYAAARAVTAVAAKGGHPFGVRVSVLVPADRGRIGQRDDKNFGRDGKEAGHSDSEYPGAGRAGYPDDDRVGHGVGLGRREKESVQTKV